MATQYLLQSMIDYDEDDRYPAKAFGAHPSEEIKEIATFSCPEQDPIINEGVLCERCSSLSLTKDSFLNIEKSGERPSVDIGPYNELLNRGCALCALAMRILEYEPKLIHNIVQQTQGLAHCEWYWQDSEWITEFRDNPEMCILHVRVIFPEGQAKSQMSVELFSQKHDPQLLLGRQYDDTRISMRLIRTWMKSCEDWHQGECKKSFRQNFSHPSEEILFYAIDVNGLNLAILTPQDNYCALSYVWGPTAHFQLKEADLGRLTKPAGLEQVLDQIPTMISDAISLTRDLGFRFLWVDSICIVQDDEDNKLEVIKRMHLVYGKASLTIRAASGAHANCGLPGYRPGTRDRGQPITRIAESELILGVLPRYAWTLYHSAHSQRAWTLCQQAVWREAIAAEDRAVRFYLHELESRFKNKTDQFGQYKTALREFTRRKLSNPNDMIKAYTGVLEAQKYLMPVGLGQTWCGIHVQLIDWILLWRTTPYAKRNVDFPSWSGAGWLGEVFLPTMIQDLDRFMQWANQHTPGKFSYRPRLSISGELEVRDVLECRGVWALFWLEETWVYQEIFENPLWMLKDARGVVCGHVQIHDWPRFRKQFERAVSKVTVFIQSDRVPGQGQYLTQAGTLDYDPDSEPSPSDDDEGAGATERLPEFPITGFEGKVEEGWGRTSPFSFEHYNIMVVSPQMLVRLPTENEGDEPEWYTFYERVGIGILHNKALQWACQPGPRIDRHFLL